MAYCGAFFALGLSYGGCTWETFGSAGFLSFVSVFPVRVQLPPYRLENDRWQLP